MFSDRCSLVLLVCVAVTTCFLPRQEIFAQDRSASSLAVPESDDGLPGLGPIRRYGWFKNLWIKRRSEFASRAAEEKGSVVFLGDSITQGWGDDFRGDFAPMKVANRGISGDTTRGMLIRLDEDVLSLDPAAVVMLMGTNDLEEKAEPETIASNIRLILDVLKSHRNDLPIVICQVFPSSSSKSRPADKIVKLNSLVAKSVKGDPQITIVDTWKLFANEAGDAKKEEFPDLLHPNAAGYAKWKAAIWPLFATLGFVETAVDTFELEAGYESLFNGRDLTGWGFRPTSPKMLKSRERWLGRNPDTAPAWPIVTKPIDLTGRVSSPEGRYVAKHGRLIVTTPPEGRKIQQLWTEREFPEDFTLKLEFRAMPNADSGVFLRGPQLQCRDYWLAGPYTQLEDYRPGEWNELVVTVKDSVAHCTCNGQIIEAAIKLPASGPIGLEGDRGQIEYRRIRIKRAR